MHESHVTRACFQHDASPKSCTAVRTRACALSMCVRTVVSPGILCHDEDLPNGVIHVSEPTKDKERLTGQTKPVRSCLIKTRPTARNLEWQCKMATAVHIKKCECNVGWDGKVRCRV